jgi:hypothetical protein
LSAQRIHTAVNFGFLDGAQFRAETILPLPTYMHIYYVYNTYIYTLPNAFFAHPHSSLRTIALVLVTVIKVKGRSGSKAPRIPHVLPSDKLLDSHWSGTWEGPRAHKTW